MDQQCKVCEGKGWIVLQQHPLYREYDLVAPCVECSGDKSLQQIEHERGIKLERGPRMEWREQVLQ